MLLHCLGKLQIQIFCRCGRKRKQIAFLITSNFVIHPQILIFLVFKIPVLSPYWLQIKFSMSLFLPIYFRDKFVALEIRHSRHHCNVCQHSTWYSAIRTRLWFKKFIFKGVHSKDVTDKFPEKSWTKHSVNKLLKRLRDTVTVDRRPGGGRRAVPALKKTLRQLMIRSWVKRTSHRPTGLFMRYHGRWVFIYALKMHNLFAFFLYLLNICRKCEFLISKVCSNMHRVRWIVSWIL